MKKVVVLHSDQYIMRNLKSFLEENGFEALISSDIGAIFNTDSRYHAGFIYDPEAVAFICSYDWGFEDTTGVEIIAHVKALRPELTRILLTMPDVREEEKDFRDHFVGRDFEDELGPDSPVRAKILELLPR